MTWTKLAVIGLAIVSLLIIWQTHQIWSATFLGVLFALSLNGSAEWIRPYIHMPHWLATSLVMLVVLLTQSGLGWIIGSPMSTQFDEVSKALPAAAQEVSVWLDKHPLGKSILKRVEVVSGRSNSSPQPDDATEVHSFAGSRYGIGTTTLRQSKSA